MVGIILDKEVKNFEVSRHFGQRSAKDVLIVSLGILVFFMLAMVLFYIPNQTREQDYQIEAARKALDQMNQESAILRARYDSLTGSAVLEREAIKLGMTPTDIVTVRHIALSDPSNRTLLAMKIKKGDTENR